MQEILKDALPFVAVAIAILAGVVASWLIRRMVLALNRGRDELRETSRLARAPLQIVLILIGVKIALALTTESGGWRTWVDHLLLIALIGAIAWLAVTMLLIVEAILLARYSVDVSGSRRARRLQTQLVLARRIAVALIIVLAVGSSMLTFPAVQALGAGLLASAGVISIVAGLAAQTSLVNVFAGIQLAFTDAIRVGDVVVVEKEWGRIEEITLTYVVVHIWDDRRLILPSTHFTTTPFENWTRRQTEIMGTVEFDLDWRTPLEAMRAELRTILASSELWNKKVGILQITDATKGFVRVRILVSADDSAALFDLRCLIREELVTFLQQAHPESLPQTRLQTGSAKPSNLPRQHAQPGEAQLFTGSIEATERSRAFSGPGKDVFEDRDKTIASRN